jgi:hypothetical protein
MKYQVLKPCALLVWVPSDGIGSESPLPLNPGDTFTSGAVFGTEIELELDYRDLAVVCYANQLNDLLVDGRVEVCP